MKYAAAVCGVFNNFPENCTKWEVIRKIDERNYVGVSRKKEKTGVPRCCMLAEILRMKIKKSPRKLNSTKIGEIIGNLFKPISDTEDKGKMRESLLHFYMSMGKKQSDFEDRPMNS